MKAKLVPKPAERRRHALRGSTGKFVPSSQPKPFMPSWNAPGASGFFQWLADVRPNILTSENRYQPFQPTQHQRESINAILAIDDQGSFAHSLSILSMPRRHGKSTINALIVLWLASSRPNQTIQILGNSELHSRRTQFRTLLSIIESTPRLARLIPEESRTQYEIKFPKSKSVVWMVTGNNYGAVFGLKLSCLWISDFHACPDLSVWNAVQAGLLDSSDSLVLIDTNVGTVDDHIASLESEAKEDPSILFRSLSYKDFEQYEREAPPWINRARARRLQRTALEPDWKRDLLGQRSDTVNSLFSSQTIALCRSPYKAPVADVRALTQNRKFLVGAGLDRAKSLSTIAGSDATVWTVTAKVASPQHGEPEFYVLNQVSFTLNTDRAIKKQILQDHERYGLHNVTLENYETASLSPFLSDMKIPHELVSAHDTTQNASFPELHRIAREGRLHFPADLRELASEMSTFIYTQRTGGQSYSFGHASSRFHDDRVYSLNWSIFSLREAVLNLYILGHIVCKNKTPRKHLCFLMGGEMELLCSHHCPAYQEVAAMFREYKAIRLDDDLTIQEFFESRVRLEGARISQAA